MGLEMIKLRASHQDIQDKRRMNPPNLVVMMIIILTRLVDGNLFNVLLGTRIFILNIIGGWNHHQISLIHEEKKNLKLKERIFAISHWPREINLKRGQVRGSLELETLLLVGGVKCYMDCKKNVRRKS
jgi:hypothetical protein